MRYNPLAAPDPESWIALTDEGRFAAVSGFHDETEPDLANRRNHCWMHVMLENRVIHALAPEATLPDRFVAETLERLVHEGLDRHEAIHAISDVTYGAFLAFMAGDTSTLDSDQYREELTIMTAETWRKRPAPLW